MLKPLIRTLNGWRFELPLALVLGASVAFAMIAMPFSAFAGIAAVRAHNLQHVLDWMLAAAAAIAAGAIAYRAMRHPWSGEAAPVASEPEEEPEAPPIDVALRLRRSDAHPDFPPREPIIASRDLGEPFMDIVGFDDGADAPVGGAGIHSLNGEYVDLSATDHEPVIAEPVTETTAATEASDADKPVFEDVVAPQVADIAVPEPEALAEPPAEPEAPETPVAPRPLTLVEDNDEDVSIAAFTPESASEPAPQPERARRESLAEMMERLSAGLERRAGRPVAPPPADMIADALARPRAATPELRNALDELNRLAGRHH